MAIILIQSSVQDQMATVDSPIETLEESTSESDNATDCSRDSVAKEGSSESRLDSNQVKTSISPDVLGVLDPQGDLRGECNRAPVNKCYESSSPPARQNNTLWSCSS
ncbi:hypothetical protein SNE40_008495 [Patella caerulea]|uniref:Uncharacterized protein n=1 Tax=Patella caerulea TaxID=87958 RepID=A0AAN8K072_PATCE